MWRWADSAVKQGDHSGASHPEQVSIMPATRHSRCDENMPIDGTYRGRVFRSLFDLHSPRNRHRAATPDGRTQHQPSIARRSRTPRGLVSAAALDDELLRVARQCKDSLLPGIGRQALVVVTRYDRNRFVQESDRHILVTAMIRSHSFMCNVENIIRRAVANDVNLDRAAVNYSFLRWSECNDIAQRCKLALTAMQHGSCEASSESLMPYPSCVSASGSVHCFTPRRSKHCAPLPTPRSRPSGVPNYSSIAARWRRSNEAVVHADSFTDGEGAASWRSAAEHRRGLELKRLQSQISTGLSDTAKGGSDSPSDACSPRRDVHASMIYRVKDLLMEIEGPDIGEASFLLWLGTHSPAALLKIERLLVDSDANEANGEGSPTPRHLGSSNSISIHL